MGRSPCCDEKEGLKKGPWTPDEDQKLVAYIQQHGHGSWRSLPHNAGLARCGKSCRLRWTNYLRPDIKRGRFSHEEEQMIVHLHAILGNRWSAIASHLPRRTDNEIKNYWNTHLKKRLVQMGIDPVTHKSTAVEQLVLDSMIPGLRPLVSSQRTHMSQWDCARAEAEARLSRKSSLTSSDLRTSQQQFMKAKTNIQGASTTFMSTWKAQVAETLRPNFGVVELDKTPVEPVNFQTFLQDWESSLQAAPVQFTGFSAYDSPIEVPDLSSGAASEVVSPQYSCDTTQGSIHMRGCSILPTPAQISERLLSSRGFSTPSRIDLENALSAGMNVFSLARMNSDSQLSAAGSSFNYFGVCSDPDNQFSPTSTLRGPDHDSYTNSPCGSSTSASECFELNPSTFPINYQATDQSKGSLLFTEGPSFWSRQQAATVEALQPEYFLPELEVASQESLAHIAADFDPVGVPNNIPIPHFDSLC